MPEYRRQTHTYTLDQLRPELAQAIREHLEAKQISEDIIACCETMSDKVGSAWYDFLLGDEAEPLTYLALVLTPQRLIWARSNERITPIVASAPFRDLFIKVVRPRGTQDFALQLSVRMERSHFTVNGRLILGPEPAAEKFCIALGEAMGFDLLAPRPKPWWENLWGR